MAEFRCDCGYSKEVHDGHVGKATRCPRCHTAGIILGSSALVPVEPEIIDLPRSTVTLRASGGSIRTPLRHGIVLNKHSSLEREFITIIHCNQPAGLTACVGITTVFEEETDFSSSRYIYISNFSVKAHEDIRAVEIRFLLFDIWGRHVKTLCATEIEDVGPGYTLKRKGQWELYDENEACEHYASIAYLATIRTAAGLVCETDIEPVLEEAKKFSAKFSAENLEPSPRKR